MGLFLPHVRYRSPLAAVGGEVIYWVRNMGAMAIFFAKAFVMIFRPRQMGKIIQQVYYIGARSMSIVMLVALFTGMVLGLQLYYALVKFGSQGALGMTISLALVRELGPVLAAIVITARAGSAMAAEVGIQRISEQIDALYSMRIDPLGYLVSPRIAASILSFPLLTALYDVIGIVGGYVSTVVLLGLDSGTYFHGVEYGVEMEDIRGGFVKSVVFAIIVSTICCFQGYFTHMREDGHGAKAVGLSTTSAVVASCVLILVADYVVTSFLM